MSDNEVVTQLDETAKRDIAKYLDKCIRSARQGVQETMRPHDRAKNLMWRAYVDAYQSVRTSLLGETLPHE